MVFASRRLTPVFTLTTLTAAIMAATGADCQGINQPVQINTAKTGCGKTSRSVKFSVTSTTSITTYEWFFGDGESATGPEVTHTYPDNKQYSVTLMADGVAYMRTISIPL